VATTTLGYQLWGRPVVDVSYFHAQQQRPRESHLYARALITLRADYFKWARLRINMPDDSKSKNNRCALAQPGQEGAPGPGEGEYWRWCPQCGHELHNEKCKLRCPRCHYFMSCSNFD
jgi:uncharacterized paraquat-inducible protein A